MTERWSAAVLAGGRSRRMGRDKAFVVVDGRTMVERVVDAAAAAGAERVGCVGGDVARLRGLGLEAVPDRAPGTGPLGGVCTALDVAHTELVVVLACDLVTPSVEAMTDLVATATTTDAEVTVPVVSGRPQWLHAAWRRAARLALEGAFADGERAVHRAAARLRIHEYEASAEGFADADRPEDLPR